MEKNEKVFSIKYNDGKNSKKSIYVKGIQMMDSSRPNFSKMEFT